MRKSKRLKHYAKPMNAIMLKDLTNRHWKGRADRSSVSRAGGQEGDSLTMSLDGEEPADVGGEMGKGHWCRPRGQAGSG